MDFARSRVDDPAWWRRLRVVLDVTDRLSLATTLGHALDFYLARLAGGKLDGDGVKKVAEAAAETYQDLLDARRPWAAAAARAAKEKQGRDARSQFIAVVGSDPTDPAFLAWEAEQVRALEAGAFDETDPAAEAEAAALERLRQRSEAQAAAGRPRRRP